MGDAEDAMARAERRVRETEGRVAHQVATVEELDRDRHERIGSQWIVQPA